MTMITTINPQEETALSESEQIAHEDVRQRVSHAIDCIEGRDGDLATLLHLRQTLGELMDQVKMVELKSPELVAMIAVLAPANGRRLESEAIERSLRPVLRLVSPLDSAQEVQDGPGMELASPDRPAP
jgi:hypothetical protein